MISIMEPTFLINFVLNSIRITQLTKFLINYYPHLFNLDFVQY